MDAEYTHTTIEYAEPNIWRHPRDATDAKDGMDVEPLDDPISEALATEFAMSENLLSIVTHVEALCEPVCTLETEVTIHV